jgi:dipeptidyl-peptidase-3
LSIFGYSGQEAEDIFYINWLIMVRAGIRALEYYTPATQKWGQAHMQARYGILRTLVAAEGGLVDIKVEQ